MSSPLQEIGQVLLGQNYGICATVSLVLFEWIITLPQEIQLVWAAKWTPGKVLFLFIRYVSVINCGVSLYVQYGTTVTIRSCSIAMYWTLLSMFATSAAAELVLTLRTWALWNKSIALGIILFSSWLAATTASLFYTIRSIMGSSPFNNFFGLPGCINLTSADAANDAVKVYAFACALECVIFIFTMTRGVQQLSKNSPTLMKVLYRDAFIASIITLGFGITDVVLSATQNPNFYFWCLIGFAFSFVVPTRIILNLRASTMQLDQWDVSTGRLATGARGIEAGGVRSPRRLVDDAGNGEVAI